MGRFISFTDSVSDYLNLSLSGTWPQNSLDMHVISLLKWLAETSSLFSTDSNCMHCCTVDLIMNLETF